MIQVFSRDAAANYGLKGALFAIRHNLGVHTSVTLEDAEYYGLAGDPATAFAYHSTSSKVPLVNFDLALSEGRSALALFGDALPEFEKDRSDRLTRQSRQPGHVRGSEIEREVANQLNGVYARKFRPPVIAV